VARKVRLTNNLQRVVRLRDPAPAPSPPPPPAPQPARGVAGTLWRLVREVPQNLRQLAGLAGMQDNDAILWDAGSGTWVAAPVQGGESGPAIVTSLDIDAGTVAVDCARGRLFRLELDANVTGFTFANLDPGEGVDLVIRIEQGDPARYISWPAAFVWPGREVQPVSVVPGSVDLLRLSNFGDPESWLASLQHDFGGRAIVGVPAYGVNRESYASEFVALGADGTVYWTILSGSLPAGLHIVQDGSDVMRVEGVPSGAAGAYIAVVRYTDQFGSYVDRALIFNIAPAPASLLHFDGTTGSTVLTDAAGPTWTVSGSGGSIQNDELLLAAGNWRNTNTGRARSTNAALTGTGSQALTVSFFAKTPAPADLQCLFILGGDSTTGGRVCGCFVYPDGRIGLYGTAVKNSQGMSEATAVVAPAGSYPFGEVVHVEVSLSALMGSSRTFRIFINGVKVRELTGSSATLNASGLTWGYGYYTAQRTHVGRIDEARVTVGAVVHTTDFTPPVVPSSFPQPIAALAITGSLPEGVAGVAYSSATAITIHGTATPFTVSVVEGALPAGWTATVNGTHVEVVGPGVVAGAYSFTLQVADAAARTVRLPLTVLVE